ncbi:alpha/beta-hydrolase [Parathielavia hyrcaniae]|uniref:Alpha/beta-hydrolase n=1 Tax=Parathielavia hyrcaniae TaxID=113614 RepID=A0AAN6Q809_9PEZI|nr:alpha/beta-hydrolase [Parathielavia hyrcaniae]
MASLSASTSPRLSVGEGLSLLFKLAVLFPPNLLVSLLRSYTLAALRGIPLQHFATCAFYRVALHGLTPRQLQFIQPSTEAVYAAWLTRRQSRAAAANLKHKRDSNSNGNGNGNGDPEAAFLASRLRLDTEPLPDGRSSLLWIGDRQRATRFVLFFHGGGYMAPALPGHLEWCARAYLLASPAARKSNAACEGAKEEEVAVAVLQYTLCPEGRYPTQLRQAAAALAHLFASGRVRPGNLVLGGDSAGGNLMAQVLGHLLRPNAAVGGPVEGLSLLRAGGERLAGAFLVSPVLSVSSRWASVRRNGGIDMLSASSAATLKYWMLEGVEEYEAEVGEGKGWAMPMDLEDVEGWFRGLDSIVKDVYVTVGEQEVLLDHGVGFADAVRRGNPGLTVQLDVMKNEAHDWILMEGGKGVDGDAMKRMRAWFVGVLGL